MAQVQQLIAGQSTVDAESLATLFAVEVSNEKVPGGYPVINLKPSRPFNDVQEALRNYGFSVVMRTLA